MSIEGLWTARFGGPSAPNKWVNGGVVVIESGRIFGGDGGTYYLGKVEIEGGKLTARFKVEKYDHSYTTAFGDISSPFDVVAIGEREGDRIVGQMTSTGKSIAFDLTKRADLP